MDTIAAEKIVFAKSYIAQAAGTRARPLGVNAASRAPIERPRASARAAGSDADDNAATGADGADADADDPSTDASGGTGADGSGPLTAPMIAAGCTIGDVIEQGASRDLRRWRPQAFGTASDRDIRDPLVEPLWIGRRVLVHLERSGTGLDVEVVDAAGTTVSAATADGLEAIVDELRDALRAESLVLDGYLTHQATDSPSASGLGSVEVPGAAELTTRMFLGRGTRHKELAEEARAVAAAETAESPLAFVAVDLLAIDGTPLLDVPLLERKRLLESALAETKLVRRSAYVRQPIDSWLGTWRALGFVSVAFKAANGRYQPGGTARDWAVVRIPKR